MTSTSPNPKVEEIQRNVQASYTELQQLLDGTLATEDQITLYRAPNENEWTIMQNLAHIMEFMPYWANEIEKLVAHSGQNFGRTMQDEGRLRAISEHGTDNLTQIKAALPASYARLEEALDHLKDNDLALTGHHSKFGEQSLAWFIHDFVTKHLSDHVAQIKACLAAPA